MEPSWITECNRQLQIRRGPEFPGNSCLQIENQIMDAYLRLDSRCKQRFPWSRGIPPGFRQETDKFQEFLDEIRDLSQELGRKRLPIQRIRIRSGDDASQEFECECETYGQLLNLILVLNPSTSSVIWEKDHLEILESISIPICGESS